jgi:CheY-like chemotaxis protein
MIDPHQFENALLNLSLNARDAMPNGGVLTIEISNTKLDEAYTGRYDDVVPGDYVMVAVSDNGTGMPPDVLEKVFEPFFTTKGVGEGSGLGLSMVYGFAKQSNGHISIYSEEGLGTTAKLFLPRSGENVTQKITTKDNTSLTRGSERILVVEDDESVREISVNILRVQGYEVVEVGDGKSAIQQITKGPPFNLLFTDIVLPGGMSGVDIAEKAKILQPSIKVIYTTGYAENAINKINQQDPDMTLISKPFRQIELLEKIRLMLDGEIN